MVITFLKLGGSLITDKRIKQSFRDDVVKRLAQEIKIALDDNPSNQLIIGHGSGSFGHFEANKHRTIQGVHTTEEWRGFAQVSTIASKLNYLVANALNEAQIPILRLQPSASALCEDGTITYLATDPIVSALKQGLTPLVHGDVAFDIVRGGTIISTETILTYIARHIPVKRIVLLGEVEGVYDNSGAVIPKITTDNFEHYKTALRGADGVDVTGGMFSKVADMIQLAITLGDVKIHICSGLKHGLVTNILLGATNAGTTISQY